MTKFSDEFKNEIVSFYKENKGKYKYSEETGTHVKKIVHRTFGIKDVAEHFSLTINQVKRIIHGSKS
tara:strand:- start:813 stop:1013 length:201 start_codon:yes stop_codon:yes gene_type:complete